MQKRMVARRKQVKVAHVKPYAYLPRRALWPALLRALRPLTVHALEIQVSTTFLYTIPVCLHSRHQSSGNSLEDHGQESEEASQVSAQTSNNGGNADQEGNDGEKEGDEVESP